jgi:hypothetical protein
MSTEAITITGLFETEKATLTAMDKIQEKGFTITEVHSPIPSSTINKALGRKKSKIGWFTLVGGILGFFCGFALAIFTATRWNLIVGGKPIVSWIPFFVIAFECTILFAVFGNVLGVLTQVGLPHKGYEKNYAPECSGDLYGVQIASMPGDVDSLKDLLHRTGSLKE